MKTALVLIAALLAAAFALKHFVSEPMGAALSAVVSQQGEDRAGRVR